jgi:hypothetical protein
MEVPEINVDEHIIGLTDQIMEAVMAGSIFTKAGQDDIREAVRAIIGRAFYMRASKDVMSDTDLVSVMLRVADWRAIADNMCEDADACNMGEHEAMLDQHATDAEVEAAIREDARAPAYVNAHSTQKCADIIYETLREHGWPG